MDLQLTSPVFQDGEPIPPEYTGDGLNISPPLRWTEPPSGTKSLALACIDPDAPKGAFTHWVAFNLPPESRELGEDVPKEPTLPNGTVQGANDLGLTGYAGPAPPRGKPHHYVFKLMALDTELGLEPGASFSALKAATPGHVLAETELVGTYGR